MSVLELRSSQVVPAPEKVLVLGTSHIGALRSAAADIRRDFPMLDVQYYGLPGRMFFDGKRNAGNIFGPDPDQTKHVDTARRINGAVQIDLTPFDEILLVGPRFGLFWFYNFCARYDVQGYARAQAPGLMSGAGFEAALNGHLAGRAAGLAAILGPDSRVTVAPAPYPGVQLAENGPDRIGAFARFQGRPDANKFIARFEEVAAQQLAQYQYRFLGQPSQTLASPGGTRQIFSTGAPDFRHPDAELLDHKHMNAAYGRAVFTDYAAQLRVSGPDVQQSDTINTEEG